MKLLDGRPRLSQFGKPREIIFVKKFDGFFDVSGSFRQRFHIFAAFDLAEIFLNPFFRLHRVEIARDDQRDIVRHIPAAEKFLHILKRRGLKSSSEPMTCQLYG